MKRRIAITASAATAILAIALYLFGKSGTGSTPAATQPAAAPEVPVAEVLVRPVAATAQYTGFVAAVRTVEVRPRVGGYLQSVNVPEGGLVRRGQTLFQVDPRPFRAALERARAELARAEERHALARVESERAQRLLERRVVSQERFDAADAARRETAAEVQAARALLSAAELDLEYAQVKAPIAGRASRALVTEGNLVMGGEAGSATLLTTIVSVDPVHVHFDIDESTYLALAGTIRPDGRPDREIPVRVAMMTEEGLPHAGQLDFIDNRIDRATGTIRARAMLRNAEGRLTPGAFARVELTTGAPLDTVLIADEAIGTAQGQRYVLAVSAENVAEYRPVKLGPLVDGLRVVQDGLAPGERVVLKGLVRPGMRLTPRPAPMVPAADAQSRTTSRDGTSLLAVQSSGR